MDIPIHAKVKCVEDEYGESTQVIINPVSRTVTHVVVREAAFPGVEHLIPIDLILESSPDEIRLRCSIDELKEMPVFNRLEYEPGNSPYLGYPLGGYSLLPYMVPDVPTGVEIEQIPTGEMAIRRGAEVKATDGAVGNVSEFLVDPVSSRITHLILREGHLFGKKDVTIPVANIQRIENDTIYLTLDKKSIDHLPAIPARRAI